MEFSKWISCKGVYTWSAQDPSVLNYADEQSQLSKCVAVGSDWEPSN